MIYALILIIFLVGSSKGDDIERIMSKDVFPTLFQGGKTNQKQLLGYVKVGKKGYVFYQEQGKIKREPFGNILDIRRGKMYMVEGGKIKIEEFKFLKIGTSEKSEVPKNLPPLRELLEGGKSGSGH